MKLIQTFDDKTYEVTDEQGEKIRSALNEKKVPGIWIGKEYIAVASIKSISGEDTIDLSRYALPGIQTVEQDLLNEVSPQFEWVTEMFKFSYQDLQKLILSSYKKMKGMSIDQYRQFLIDQHAVTSAGQVTTGKYRDKYGKEKRAVFAYLFFAAIRKFIEKKRDQKEYAQSKEFEAVMATQG